METQQKIKTRWTGAAIVVASWTVVALAFTPQTYIFGGGGERGLSWGKALMANLLMFYIWAALTPLVLWLGRRFPFERKSWRRSVLVHLFASVVLALVHITLNITGERMLGSLGDVPLKMAVGRFLSARMATFVLIYGAILAVGQALENFRKYQEREYRLTQAQLQALKTQLDPHFFFNTLNAISELVHKDPDVADRTISRLSDLLRLTLQNSAPEVPLHNEIEFLQKYVAIQQTLLGERLRVQWDIDDAALDVRVPNMILQPLVENAIRHGIAPRAAGGRLEITARLEAGHLQLTVRDDGPGLTAQAMPEAQAMRNVNEQAASTGGIGLSNTRARLHHLYGAAHHFELSNAPGGGLAVQISIPAHESETESAPHEAPESQSRQRSIQREVKANSPRIKAATKP